jgi:hypothetical protein
MPKIRDNAEIFRALGRFLDDQGATTFEIVNHTAFLGVSWDSGELRGQRAYQEHHLVDLRAEARAMRQGTEGPVGPIVELLRTVGQELDLEGVDVSSIWRDSRAFHVSGVLDDRHYQSEYRTKDLVAIAAGRRAARGNATAVATGEQPAPSQRPRAPQDDRPHSFFGVELGARVYAEDGEFIGEVLDIRNRYFKVAKPREEGCWLPAEAVGSITRSGHVILSPIV